MRNLKATLRYDGTDFAGWQVQPELPTVQGALADALERITGEPTKVTGAGRTDSGVHALGQVANFKTASNIATRNLERAVNSMLAPGVRIDRIEEVPEKFDARRHALNKLYRYSILIAEFPDPLLTRYSWQLRVELDTDLMKEAAQNLVGKHDFTSFQGSAGKDRSPIRTIYSLDIEKVAAPYPGDARDTLITIDICADGFVYKMVRNIVGTLVEVGRAKIEPQHLKEILDVRDRQQAGPAAPAPGLCLISVQY
jgi:tRNA pseudouridine38-40 synthase